MAQVPVDPAAVDACRAFAADIADDVQRFIDRAHHRRRRAHGRARLRRRRRRRRGHAARQHAGRSPPRAKGSTGARRRLLPRPRAARGRRARCRRPPRRSPSASERSTRRRAAPAVRRGRARRARARDAPRRIARIDARRATRARRSRRATRSATTPLKYVIVATGNIYDDAVQAKAARFAGADIVAVIRATAQSLLDYVPEGADHRGLRRHLRHAGELPDHPQGLRRGQRRDRASTAPRPTTRRASA